MKNTIIIFLIAFSVPVFSQWVQTASTPQGSGITGMVVTDPPYENFIVVTTGSVSGGQSGGIRTSYDGGQTWTNNVNCYIGRTITKGTYGYLFASMWFYPATNEGIYRSSNGGQDWIPIYNFSSTGNNIFSLLNKDYLIVAGTRTGVLKSTDNGANFSYSNNGMTPNSWVLDLAIDSSNIIAAATSNGLFISTNLGDSWQQATGLPAGDTVTSIGFYSTQSDNSGGDILFNGTRRGKLFMAEKYIGYSVLELKADFGSNFNSEKIKIISRESFSIMYIVGRPKNTQQPGGGVYQSINGGQTFTQLNQGLPQSPNVSSIIGETEPNFYRLYVGFFNNTNNRGAVYKQTVPIGIHSISNEMPKGFSLMQNYPNPFNPKSKIKYQISKTHIKNQKVELVVYNSLGQIIEILVNESQQPGTYEVEWNASEYPSGVYFYQLKTNEFVDTKKMLLIK